MVELSLSSKIPPLKEPDDIAIVSPVDHPKEISSEDIFDKKLEELSLKTPQTSIEKVFTEKFEAKNVIYWEYCEDQDLLISRSKSRVI
jgi:hypothetical protein